MRTIIAGSRDITDYNLVLKAIKDSQFNITTIFSGKARGIDTLGERYATENNIPVVEFPADWDKYKNRAGHIRNRQMAVGAQALIAIWDGISPGTPGMIQLAKEYRLRIYVMKVSVI